MNVGIEDTGIVTSAIQLGFIAGTLIFAFFSLSDRYSPRKIFFACAVLGSITNLMIYFMANNLMSLLIMRFLTGFLLTGIYPVGMKIAAGWYKDKLGNAIGLLVGSLVPGTAFPHLLKSFDGSLPLLNAAATKRKPVPLLPDFKIRFKNSEVKRSNNNFGQ